MSFNPKTGAKVGQASVDHAYVVVPSCAKLHCVMLYNNTGADLFIHVFIAGEVPTDGGAPDLPPVKVGDTQTIALDYGDSGRPLSKFAAIASTTSDTLTQYPDALFLDVTYS